MLKLISWILGFAFTVGIGDAFVRLTIDMAHNAHHAIVFDQISYSDFNRQLLSAKPRTLSHHKIKKAQSFR